MFKKVVLSSLLALTILLSSCSKDDLDKDDAINDDGIINFYSNFPDFDSLVVVLPKADESLVVPISEAKGNFQKELAEISESNLGNFDLSDIKKASFPDISEFSFIMKDDRETTFIENIETAKKYAEFFYPEDANEEVYKNRMFATVWVEEYGLDGNKDDPDEYPYAYELYEKYGDRLVNANVHIDTENFYLQTISKYVQAMGLGGFRDIYDPERYDVSGYIFSAFDKDREGREGLEASLEDTFYAPEFNDKKYQLSGGEYSTNEVAEFVKDYFENKIPYGAFEGIKTEVTKISVYGLPTDEYAFKVNTRRVYENIPFDDFKYGVGFSDSSDGKSYSTDSKNINILKYGQVESFYGFSESQGIIKMGEPYTDIIPLKTATELAANKFSGFTHLRVDEIKLVYCFTERDDSGDSSSFFQVAVPWWKYTCWYGLEKLWINVFVNSVTGDVRYVAYNSD